MSAKDLKDLSRTDLLELLIQRTEELEQVKEQLQQALSQQSSECVPVYESAGTMAEAAVQVNGVFEAADRAAKQYLEYMEQMVRRQEETCAQIEREAKEKAERLILEAEIKCSKMEKDTQVHCSMMLRNAEHEAGRNWNDLFTKLDRLSEENAQLRSLMDSDEKKRKWSL